MKDKGKILNTGRGKNKQLLTYREKIIKMTVDYSTEITEAQGSKAKFSKCSKKRQACQSRVMYTAEISSGTKKESRCFQMKEKTKRICHQKTYAKND